MVYLSSGSNIITVEAAAMAATSSESEKDDEVDSSIAVIFSLSRLSEDKFIEIYSLNSNVIACATNYLPRKEQDLLPTLKLTACLTQPVMAGCASALKTALLIFSVLKKSLQERIPVGCRLTGN